MFEAIMIFVKCRISNRQIRLCQSPFLDDLQIDTTIVSHEIKRIIIELDTQYDVHISMICL
jgi:hypothetical protein